MAVEEEDGGNEIPEWVVTFGDMMSLLLTFFIMLVSMSEVKQEERFQAMVESFRQQFGHDASYAAVAPGPLRPRNSNLDKLASEGRAKRKDTMDGGAKLQAPVGENKRVQSLRPQHKDSVGTTLVFDEMKAKILDDHKTALKELMPKVAGKPQKIEVRGHTSRRPVRPSDGFADSWELAYERARNTMQFLVSELDVDPQRIRIAVAGPFEPFHIGTDPEKMRVNSRVEVILLDEVLTDLVGTKKERQERFLKTGSGASTSMAVESQPVTPVAEPDSPATDNN